MKRPSATGNTPRPATTKALPKPPDLTVGTAVEKLLATLDLDEAGGAKAAIARALARKLDESVSDSTAGVAMATAGIAKELREVVDAILEGADDAGAFVAELFSPVGDT